MAKTKYYFNPNTSTYEQVKSNPLTKFFKIGGFILSSFLLVVALLYSGYSFIDSPEEKQLKREIAQMRLQYEILEERMGQVSVVLKDIQERDDSIYRVLFNTSPISLDIRQAGYGGVDRYENLKNYRNSDIMVKSAKKLDEISKTLIVQSKSYEELLELAESKSEMMASIPAISPINSKNLHKGISGFGSRIHPIYKIKKSHMGMDFAAATGTPIYATGDGIIRNSGNERGYGNMVKIDHDYGYETLYGHMSRIKTRRGQKVQRGDVIGYVGSTGLSSGPHLHYEVHKDGEKIDPISFFYDDVNPDEFKVLFEKSQKMTVSLD